MRRRDGKVTGSANGAGATVVNHWSLPYVVPTEIRRDDPEVIGRAGCESAQRLLQGGRQRCLPRRRVRCGQAVAVAFRQAEVEVVGRRHAVRVDDGIQRRTRLVDRGRDPGRCGGRRGRGRERAICAQRRAGGVGRDHAEVVGRGGFEAADEGRHGLRRCAAAGAGRRRARPVAGRQAPVEAVSGRLRAWRDGACERGVRGMDLRRRIRHGGRGEVEPPDAIPGVLREPDIAVRPARDAPRPGGGWSDRC